MRQAGAQARFTNGYGAVEGLVRWLQFLPPAHRLGLFATAAVSGQMTGNLKLPLVLEYVVKTTFYNGIYMNSVTIIYKIFKKFCHLAGISYSFSSDGEDYALLKYLMGIDNGVYIDIGANHPIRHSNTFLFYLNGWRGICVEPIPKYKRLFRLLRAGDLFINAGITSASKPQSGLVFFYYKNFPDNSTFDVQRVKHLEQTFNRIPSAKIDVHLLSVADLLIAHADRFGENNPIHLLNLDTEGYECDILKGFFTAGVFPWIVCVEDLGKTCHTISSSRIHQLMIDNGYILCARTFLSSIYVKKQHLDKLLSPFVKELVF